MLSRSRQKETNRLELFLFWCYDQLDWLVPLWIVLTYVVLRYVLCG